MSSETFEGSGTVTPEGAAPDTQAVPVEFSFNIEPKIGGARQRPGMPPPPHKLKGRGTVTATDGTRLSQGFYRLRTSAGVELRIQNLGTEWSILGDR